MFNKRSKRPVFLLRPLKSMLSFEVDRSSLQKLEYKIDHTDYHVDYNFFEIWYCGHPSLHYANIQFKPATYLILSHLMSSEDRKSVATHQVDLPDE